MNSVLRKEPGRVFRQRQHKCKGPEAGMSVGSLKTSKEASVGRKVCAKGAEVGDAVREQNGCQIFIPGFAGQDKGSAFVLRETECLKSVLKHRRGCCGLFCRSSLQSS